MSLNDQIRKRKEQSLKELESIKKEITDNNDDPLSGGKLSEKNILKSFNESYASMTPEKSSYHLTRIVLIRYIAFIYGF